MDHQSATRRPGPFQRHHCSQLFDVIACSEFISEVLHIPDLTTALTSGLSEVRFLQPVPVTSILRATVSLISAQQRVSGVESVFGLTYDIDGMDGPACMAEVIVLYPCTASSGLT
jgi:hypothetical protein